ncbi:putative flavin-containing amine oxidase [Lojkania enalia]|uniref:Flavin-containing amine oxidase n=1 Tax=Lojkania enalia TaxID=147567 RepID=A0A9P4KGH6_9PLEO|nr:putative flavin-containing amine oxidase [Didymosphaeria enalia]
MGAVPHVCIVGAGMSGLKCSETLIRNGARVTIYEARHRTGGRVHQSDKLGHLIDLGPSWIHGTDHNPFVKLAKQTGSTVHDMGDLNSIFDCTGKYLDRDVADKQTNEVWRILDEGFEYSAKHSEDIPEEKSLWDFVQEKVEEGKYEADVGRNILDHMKMWGAMIGTEIERQSLKFFWLERVIDGESLFLASTYKDIADLVKKKGLTGAELHLSTAVTGIRSLEDEDEMGKIEVQIANGTATIFDEVVVTAPLGWLKHHKDIFEPPLPPSLSNSIDHIFWGHLEKAWVTFPTAWWDTDSELYPGETLFIRPEYAPETNPESWNQEAMSLSVLPPPFNYPTLRFSMYGKFGKTLTSQIHKLDPYSKEYYDILNSFFRPYYSKLPNYDPDSDQCVPKAFECTTWQHDPWTGHGSYSNFQVGIEHADNDIEIYRAGMGPDRGIWFAGEAAAPFSVLGTVTGAYWSGEIVASKILTLYGVSQEEVQKKQEEEGALPSGAVVKGVVQEA